MVPMMEDGYYLVVTHVLVLHHHLHCTNVATDGPTNITLQRVDKLWWYGVSIQVLST